MIATVSQIITDFIKVNRIDYDPTYSRLSKLHKYWARKPWFVIEKYISRYSNEKDLVIDPFCGSGLMGLEAAIQHRNFIGYDLNPIAAFLANNTLLVDFDTDSFDNEYKVIENDLKKRIMDLYAHGDNYVLYSIPGIKNTKDYNAVLTDYDLKLRKKVTIDLSSVVSEIVIPSSLYYPDKAFPTKFYKDRFSYKGVRTVSDMFSKRNLLALALIFNRIRSSEFKYKSLFLLAFTNTLLHVSKLKAENVRPLSVNNFWIPDDFIEENVWWRFSDRVRNVRIAKTALLQRVTTGVSGPLGSHRILNKSSLCMDEIKDSSVDYVITDPPYGDAIQYSELSYIWNCWLGLDYDIQDEVIINPVQGKGIEEYVVQISKSIDEIMRVLKNRGYFTLCFHNKDSRIWIKVAELLRDAGLTVVDIASYDTFGSPYNKSWASFSPKSDIYLTMQKSSSKAYRHNNRVLDPQQIAQDICSYLVVSNGSTFNLNKAYDLFVAVLVIEIMQGNGIADYSKLNIKSIVQLFEVVLKDGNFQGRFF